MATSPDRSPSTLTQMGRVALLQAVRFIIPGNRMSGPHEWRGAGCEAAAESFLRRIGEQGPIDQWEWILCIQLLLEDGTPITTHHRMQAGQPLPALRPLVASCLRRRAEDEGSLREQRIEDHRVAELLLGARLPLELRTRFERMQSERQAAVALVSALAQSRNREPNTDTQSLQHATDCPSNPGGRA